MYSDTAKAILADAIEHGWLIDTSQSRTGAGVAVILSLRKGGEWLYIVFTNGKYTRAFSRENYTKLPEIRSIIKGSPHDYPILSKWPRRNARALHDGPSNLPVLFDTDGTPVIP